MHDGIMRELGMEYEIVRNCPDFQSVLDVGGTKKSQLPYFPDKDIYVLNIQNYGVDKRAHFMRASMLKIPFKDNGFDLVITNDTLEHIDKKDRKKGIYEMIRVAKKTVIIGVPCGKAALKYEKLILKIGRFFGRNMRWLAEHEKADLPMESELIKIIKNNPKVKNLKMIKNNNIQFWFLTSISGPLMRFIWNRFDRKKLFKLWPLFRLFNFGKTYRKFFVIRLE